MDISDNLKTIRRERRLSQRELSRLSGVTVEVIGRIERGLFVGSVEHVERLALALGKRLQELDPSLSRYSRRSVIDALGGSEIRVVIVPDENSESRLIGCLKQLGYVATWQQPGNYPAAVIIKNHPDQMFGTRAKLNAKP